MAEYIEREELLRAPADILNWGDPYGYSISAIKQFPAADVAPVRHGRPVSKERNETLVKFEKVCIPAVGGEFYQKTYVDVKESADYCPECGKRLCSRFTNYCPNCGAKMDGGEMNADREG